MNQILTFSELFENLFILWFSLGTGYIIGFFCYSPHLFMRTNYQGTMILLKNAYVYYPFEIVPAYIQYILIMMVRGFKFVLIGFEIIQITISYFVFLPNWWRIFKRT